MANWIYNSFKEKISTEVDWSDNSTTTVKAMLVTSSYVPDIDLHDYVDDITNEVVGTGYTAGGAEITTRTITIDTATDTAKYDGDDVVWSSSTITARACVIYKDTGTASTSPLIAYIDFGADKQSSAGDFVIQWSADGIFKLS